LPRGVSCCFVCCAMPTRRMRWGGCYARAGRSSPLPPALVQVLKDVARTIYSVHDDVKDKDFELELSWVCEESGWVHKQVPKDLLTAAEEAAKAALEEDMEDD
jgi:hypothetical protein